MRLNLGSGPEAVPGWINIDRSPNVLLDRLPLAKTALLRLGVLAESHRAGWDRDIVRANIMDLPYENGAADAVYSSHTLEHLYLDDAQRVINEAARVLRPGGVLRLALPDGELWARELLAGGDADAGRAFNTRLLAHPPARPRLVTRLRDMAGGHIHRWQPTAALVTDMVRAAGLVSVTTCAFREGSLPDLENVETREESFFLEAVKPDPNPGR